MMKQRSLGRGWILIGILTIGGCESGTDAPGNRSSGNGAPGPAKTAAAADRTAAGTSKTAPAKPAARAGEDWNDTGIAWMNYEEGLAAAKSQGKPVCLVFFTKWCPHCKNFSHVFKDPRVEKAAKDFVMIRLDKDEHGEVSKKYAVDGEYIPRTFFLKPDGTLDESIHAPRERYKYFYNERKADDLLAAMAKAEKLK